MTSPAATHGRGPTGAGNLARVGIRDDADFGTAVSALAAIQPILYRELTICVECAADFVDHRPQAGSMEPDERRIWYIPARDAVRAMERVLHRPMDLRPTWLNDVIDGGIAP